MSRDDKQYLALAAMLFLLPGLLLWPLDAKAEIRPLAPAEHTAEVNQLRAICAEPTPEMVLVGTFTCYAYCPCAQCCGEWSGLNLTSSGTTPEEGRTIAADPSVLPLGAEVYIEGLGWRTVEDTGAGIDEYKLDLFMESHEEALRFGVQTMTVWNQKAPPTGAQSHGRKRAKVIILSLLFQNKGGLSMTKYVFQGRDAQARPAAGRCTNGHCGAELYGQDAEPDQWGHVLCPACRSELEESYEI